MAKLNAHGHHAVAKVRARRGGYTYLFALRSDNKVLSRVTSSDQHAGVSTGYKVYGTLQSGDPDQLVAALARRGFTDIEEAGR